MKPNKKFLPLIILVLFISLLPALSFGVGNFDYLPMETVPGVFTANTSAPDFNTFISSVYSFMIAIVGICALFMITLGGYMYVTSAGNATMAGKAKSIITDAIIGLILALLAYLIFNTINPALVNPAGLRPIGNTGADGTGGGATGGATGSALLFISPTDPVTDAADTAENSARAFTTANGLRVNKAGCSRPTDTNCTDVKNVDLDLLRLAGKIGGGDGVITGGSEIGVHAKNGDHPKGKAVDMRLSDNVIKNLTAEMESNPGQFNQICSRDSAFCMNCPQEACNAEPSGIVHISIN